MLSWLKGDKVDHPLANAREAKKFVDGFPTKDPLKTLEDASYWLGSVTEAEGFKVDHRFEVISLLDVATRKAQEQLLNTYVMLLDSDRIQEKRLWKAATDFWKLLGDAYLAAVDQAQDVKNVPAVFRPLLPLLAARAMRAMRHQMKWTLMRYGVVRGEIWAEIARCTRVAEAAGAAEKMITLYPQASEQTSPCYEFLRVMMLWAISPSGLSPTEQDIAERLLVRLTPKFRFDIKPWEGCDYYFDLDGGRPPMRRMKAAPVTAACRFYDAPRHAGA